MSTGWREESYAKCEHQEEWCKKQHVCRRPLWMTPQKTSLAEIRDCIKCYKVFDNGKTTTATTKCSKNTFSYFFNHRHQASIYELVHGFFNFSLQWDVPVLHSYLWPTTTALYPLSQLAQPVTACYLFGGWISNSILHPSSVRWNLTTCKTLPCRSTLSIY